MDSLYGLFDTVIFIMVAFSVLYLLLFALYSTKKEQQDYPETEVRNRFLIVIPAYKEDRVIFNSVLSTLSQDYPSDYYTITVIFDSMTEITRRKLISLPIKLVEANYENRTKAKALQLAVKSCNEMPYDVVVVLDADNVVEKDFLININRVFAQGVKAVQAHRKAKNTQTDTAILDAVSEEINNAIFRKGHVELGLSSALIGSGMAFDYTWFTENISQVYTAGEDKELELLLLKQGVFIEYLANVNVFDEKVSKKISFYKQRRRWLAAQFALVVKGMRYVPEALARGNWDYCNKICQWLLLPRLVLAGLSFLMATLAFFIVPIWGVKWMIILLVLLLALSIAMPDSMYTTAFIKALKTLPILFILLFINLLRLRGVNKKFIHTKKEIV